MGDFSILSDSFFCSSERDKSPYKSAAADSKPLKNSVGAANRVEYSWPCLTIFGRIIVNDFNFAKQS